MKKAIVLLVVGLVGLSAIAQQNSNVKPQKLSSAEIQMRRHGGKCNRRLPGKSFLFLDCRHAPKDDFSEIRGQIELFSELPCVYKAGTMLNDDKPLDVALANRNKEIAGVVVLHEGGVDKPTLTILPEECVAVMNISPYFKDGENLGNQRLEKELWRVVAFCCGGVNSFTPYCVMQSITQPSDLDKIECRQFSPEVGDMIKRDLAKWKFGRVETMTYAGACREGWAPAPTNKYQKAIWDRAQLERQFDKQAQEPTNPIKIKFNKNKK